MSWADEQSYLPAEVAGWLEEMVSGVKEIIEALSTAPLGGLDKVTATWGSRPSWYGVDRVAIALVVFARRADKIYANRVDDERLFSKSVEELCEAFGSVLCSPTEASELIWMYCVHAGEPRAGAEVLYKIGVTLTELREIDPGFQVTMSGLESMKDRVVEGERPDALVDAVRRTIIRGLAEAQ